LMHMASDDELIKLLEYPEATVKTTAYQALLGRESYDHYQLLKKAINDTTTFVSYQDGCVGELMMIAEYLSHYSIYCLSEEDCKMNLSGNAPYFRITSEQHRELRMLFNEKILQKEVYLLKWADEITGIK